MWEHNYQMNADVPTQDMTEMGKETGVHISALVTAARYAVDFYTTPYTEYVRIELYL